MHFLTYSFTMLYAVMGDMEYHDSEKAKEVAGRVRRQLHPVIVKFFFLHQATEVDPIRGKIPLYLFGKSWVGCHQIEGRLIGTVQFTAPPAHRGQLGYQ